MNKSDEIRKLAAAGVSTAEIARTLGIRYQFAYGVLARSGEARSSGPRPPKPKMKPNLTVETLCASGFEHAATWIVSSDQLALDKPLSNVAGVYAFAIGDAVQYIGVATKGFARRAYSYVRPGPSQQTSIRLNSKIVELAAAGTVVDVYVASPENGEWNSLPVDMSAGLELGLIRHFDLPWNIRGAR